MTAPLPETAPYGSWVSPITPESLVEQTVRLADVTVAGGRVYWVEGRPSEAGRMVLVSAPLEDPEAASEVLPGDFSVRSQVHEYGGRCYAVGDRMVVFTNWSDQRLWVLPAGGIAAWPLSPEPGADRPRSERYADPVVDPSGTWVIAVRERHLPDGVVNDLVCLRLEPGSEPAVVASGHDFYSSPRLSPDGRRLAWISWDHPAMPWDATELSVASFTEGVLGPVAIVAGGADESVTQPRWSPDGVLHYASDRTGWWNIYDESGRNLAPMAAEFAEPDWVFGNAGYGFSPGGELVASWTTPGGQALGTVAVGSAGPGAAPVATAFPFSSYSSVCPLEGGVVAIAGSPSSASAVVHLTWEGAAVRVLKASRGVDLPDGLVSRPEAVSFPTGGGDTAHALVYRPTNAGYVGPAGDRPPLLVVLHGGPTSSSSAVLNLAVQFWTSRGFAVADVDYRGSSGHGRAYRRKLDGAWGVADVEDCAAVVVELDRRGIADGSRAAIRGGSAGGFTTLAALAFTDAFAAGASHYGIGDLALLAEETHKFESRYTDGLVGPWPGAAEEYRRRSPVHHVDDITSPLILFQGLEDMVVPPAQSQLMYDALSARRVPVAYMAFEGEQHGFRRADTIITVMTAELAFYGRVLGFTPDLPWPPGLVLANAGALSPRS